MGKPFFQWLPGPTSGYDVFNRWDNLIQNLRVRERLIGPGAIGQVPIGYKQGSHVVVTMDPKDFQNALKAVGKFEKIPYTAEMKRTLRDVGKYIYEDVVPRMFITQGGDNHRWEPLKDTTIAWRQKMGYADGPPLIASGTLYDLATSDQAIQDITTGKNARVVIGGAKWGTPNAYKYFVHMAGSFSNLYNAPIPPRPFMPTSAKDLTRNDQLQISQIFDCHIQKLIRKK